MLTQSEAYRLAAPGRATLSPGPMEIGALTGQETHKKGPKCVVCPDKDNHNFDNCFKFWKREHPWKEQQERKSGGSGASGDAPRSGGRFRRRRGDNPKFRQRVLAALDFLEEEDFSEDEEKPKEEEDLPEAEELQQLLGN